MYIIISDNSNGYSFHCLLEKEKPNTYNDDDYCPFPLSHLIRSTE